MIKRGEYANFNELLSPSGETVPGQAVTHKKNRKAQRQVCDLLSRLEAWNIFLTILIQTGPQDCTAAGQVPDHQQCQGPSNGMC